MTGTPVTDKEFITNPNLWPYWPMLPIKRKIEDAEFPWEIGTLVAQEGKLSTIHLNVAIWDPDINEKLKTCEKKVYESIDEMLADGWQCD